MNKIYPYMIALIGSLLIGACNNEWEDELYQKSISFGKSGVVDVYIKYAAEGGQIAYQIPVLVNGTTANDKDITVSVAVNSDTLTALNFERFRNRTDLYFKQLGEEYFDIESMTTTIPAGENTGLINVNFILENLDLVDEYILPLQIASTSDFDINPRKWYKKCLMHVVPFNDYSGVYSASSGLVWDRTRPEHEQTPLNVPTRQARVVDENSIFFYAGVTEEADKNRALYKVIAKFEVIGNDSLVTLSGESDQINFSQLSGRFTVSKEMDPLLPYLEKKYTTVHLEYEYDDISNPDYPLQYRFKGSMTLERKRNTQIPEEDQQEIFE